MSGQNIRQILMDGVNVTSGVTATIATNHTVGLCIENDLGIKFVLVYNDANSINTNVGVTIASGSVTGYSVTVSTISGSSPLAGIAVTTIPTANFGFIQTSGQKRVSAASLIVSANTPLLLSSAGIFSQQSFVTGLSGSTGTNEPFASSNNVCGYILSTTTAAAGYIDCFFKSTVFPA